MRDARDEEEKELEAASGRRQACWALDASDYVEAVIPEVLIFRHKVAAHFAWATRNKRDTEAERVVSLLPPLTFNNDAFYVGSLTVTLTSGGKSSDSSALKPWSITKVHRQLGQRYWPDAVQHDHRSGGADGVGKS